MFGLIAPSEQDKLLRLQNNLSNVIKTEGQVEFGDYRAFRNAERAGDGPFRFVDGELLEKFLDLDEQTQALVCRGIGPSVEDMRNTVEELRRMH